MSFSVSKLIGEVRGQKNSKEPVLVLAQGILHNMFHEEGEEI
jgi:hypothetical protein